MSRRMTIAWVAFVLVGSVFAWPADAAPRARARAQALGRVVQAAGLTINGRPAAVGALVRQGDRLETASGGSADVVLADGAIFRLYAGSQAKLPVLTKKRTLVQLLVGSILSFVGKPMAYQVKAPKAVAAVGGTCFYMQSTPDTPNYVCACSGLVHIGSPRNRARTPVDSGFNLHQAMMVDDLGFKPGTAKNHDDHMMWELGKELQQATGIPNKYKTLENAGEASNVDSPPVEPAGTIETAPATP